jgi:hypothetical protein
MSDNSAFFTTQLFLTAKSVILRVYSAGIMKGVFESKIIYLQASLITFLGLIKFI